MRKDTICTNSLLCANNIREKIENPQLKLMARNENDIVNGSITIAHIQNDHDIRIEIYLTDENPNSRHKSTLKKPFVIPTKSQLEALL